MNDNRYDNLLERCLQNYSRKIAEDLDKSIFSYFGSTCILCKETSLQHGNEHPFFKDNLEYLEWKATGKPPLRGDRIRFI